MGEQNEENISLNSRLLAERPLFSPSADMRRGYLTRRRGELAALVSSAKGNEWKYVVIIAHHVRGTGSMFGFPNIGETAENLCRAIQNAEPNCMDYVNLYAKAVNESYV